MEICPEIFDMHSDGLAYVKEVDWETIFGLNNDDEPTYQMETGMANVPNNLIEATIESAEECPGECIFIELE